MTPTQGETALAPNFKAALYGIVLTALARASLVLAACILMDAFGGQGAALGRGLRAERASEFDQASRFYALALVNYFICYAALLAGSLLNAGND
jgi:hypothetical protein